MTEEKPPVNCKCVYEENEAFLEMCLGSVYVYNSDGYVCDLKVNFCPMCGIKVKEDNKSKEIKTGMHYGSSGHQWNVEKV